MNMENDIQVEKQQDVIIEGIQVEAEATSRHISDTNIVEADAVDIKATEAEELTVTLDAVNMTFDA